jgi:hypothetical protein
MTAGNYSVMQAPRAIAAVSPLHTGAVGAIPNLAARPVRNRAAPQASSGNRTPGPTGYNRQGTATRDSGQACAIGFFEQ